ncbi:MAG: hypothetical protein GWN07_17820 [Actinobacteria bacterium]|nr:hypothetical protein [Actinomycetota bacterium]NIS32246.1 hypothetical protein [Actinomycetota bacterium]NIU67294.1 hypothetical protein [Actinomycetota bacterium]NIW29079.1 hypothetical protein [Actinomycetota bacterium]NIX21590.1 hypothetical protein [Actinomycetota bacterium]
MTQRTTIRGTETNIATIRERFGGIDTPAALGGMFAALGILVFVGALIAAGGGALDYQLNAIDVDGNLTDVELLGALLAALVVFFAFFGGGWVAGRMARYGGGMTGIGTAIWALLLVAVFALLGVLVGTEYNAFQRAGLPDWFSQFGADDTTAAAIVTGVAMIVVMFASAYIGGRIGELYHQKIDAALVDHATIDHEDGRS